MSIKKRATGANVRLRGAFESVYGTRPAAGWYALRAYSMGLSEAQELLDEPLLGAGRDPLAPARGAIDVAGPVEVPVDRRLIGLWLKALLGAPTTAQVGARGYIEFGANPGAGDTLTLGGATWTFVAAGPAGNETLIGADLATTLASLVDDLNASADADVSDCTYSALGDRLVIQHDTADATGDAFAIAGSGDVVKTSGATLAGGGLYRHVYTSGQAALPSLSLETEHADLEAGSERFFVDSGVMVDSLGIQRQRSGAVRGAVNLIGQSETPLTASVAGAPTTLDVDLFSQFQGTLLVDARSVANVTAGNLVVGNSLDVVPELREDGYIGGADPGATAISLTLTCRYSNNQLKTAADAKQTIDVRYGFRDAASGAELLFELHEVHLPKPRREIQGPGGIEVTYEARGAQKVALEKALTVTLWNDVSSYA